MNDIAPDDVIIASTELEPCPFCGGKAEVGGDPHSDRDVHCSKCWAGVWDTCREGAVAGWNQRVMHKQQEGTA